MQEIRVQDLVGRRVHDVNGKLAGRVGEIVAERIGADCHVIEYHVGSAAFLSRLGMTAGRLVGLHPHLKLIRVPWHQMDVTDPHNPRLRCGIEELT